MPEVHEVRTVLEEGDRLVHTGRLQEAVAVLQTATAALPDSDELRFALGRVMNLAGHHAPAVRAFEAALRLNPDHGEAAFQRAITLRAVMRFEEAGCALVTMEPSHGARGSYWRERALVALQTGSIAEARRHADRALELEPNDTGALLCRAKVHELHGDRAAAFEDYRRVLSIDPGQTTPYFALARGGEFTDLQAIDAQLAKGKQSAQGIADLELAKGWILDRTGDPGAAFDAFVRAGRAANPLTDHDRDALSDYVDQLIAHQRPGASPAPGHSSEQPVFIVGVPRSGTSLVEQILAAHPEVTAMGERSALAQVTRDVTRSAGVSYPADFSTLDEATLGRIAEGYLADYSNLTSKRVTDKAPGNFHFVPLIRALFPQARILHVQRHPLDTCLSMFMGNFKPESMGFASDLEDLAAYYEGYERLMEHYSNVLGIEMLHVRYEDLVANTEEVSRRMLDFLGLDWDPRCLKFHESKRAVATASALQVREPTHTRSIGRWRKYEPYLGPLAKWVSDD